MLKAVFISAHFVAQLHIHTGNLSSDYAIAGHVNLSINVFVLQKMITQYLKTPYRGIQTSSVITSGHLNLSQRVL